MAHAPDTATEADPARHRHRASSPRRGISRRRGLEFAGLALGIAAGVGVAIGWLVPSLRHLSGPPPVNSPPVTVRSSPGPPGSPLAPDPAARDAGWAAYSDRSGCADWAAGDGVSAVRLNSSQLAWFFSDTFIGPAGPDIGFSRVRGFAHNAVVVQTGTRHGSAFVTVTGGGACTGPDRPGNAAPVVSGSSDRYWDEDSPIPAWVSATSCTCTHQASRAATRWPGRTAMA